MRLTSATDVTEHRACGRVPSRQQEPDIGWIGGNMDIRRETSLSARSLGRIATWQWLPQACAPAVRRSLGTDQAVEFIVPAGGRGADQMARLIQGTSS